MAANPRGKLQVVSCRSGDYLAESIVDNLRTDDFDVPYLKNVDFQFDDGEIGVRLDEDVSGGDIFLVQALYNSTIDLSVSENYLALCIVARTLKEWGAHKVTAILPYLAYSRQDKPTRLKREPTTAKLMADLSIEAGIDHLVTWHPHYQQIHGFYSHIPVTVLEPFELFSNFFADYRGSNDTIIVAPDAGASHVVTHLGRKMTLPVAIASKFHPQQGETEITQIIGDFAGKTRALVFDDMMSSGGTIHQLLKKLAQDTPIEATHLAISHNLCRESAYQHLEHLHQRYNLHEVITTNSIPQTLSFKGLAYFDETDLSDYLCDAIRSIHLSRY